LHKLCAPHIDVIRQSCEFYPWVKKGAEMNLIRRAMFAALGIGLLTVPAMAGGAETQTDTALSGLYAGGFIGMAWATGHTNDRFDVDGPDIFETFHLQGDVDDGHIYGAVVGWRFNDYFRIEGEISRSELDTKSHEPELNEPGFCGCITSDVDITYYMANLWVGMPINDYFSPYIGGGIGVADYDGAFDPGATPINGSSFAYQLGAGVRISAPDSPMEFDLGYRFKSVPKAEYDRNVLVEVLPPNAPPIDQNIVGNGHHDFDLGEHILQVGLNFNFR
jgi:opacity protein-like surface antigen